MNELELKRLMTVVVEAERERKAISDRLREVNDQQYLLKIEVIPALSKQNDEAYKRYWAAKEALDSFLHKEIDEAANSKPAPEPTL